MDGVREMDPEGVGWQTHTMSQSVIVTCQSVRTVFLKGQSGVFVEGGQVLARRSARTGEKKAGFEEPLLLVVIYYKEPILDPSHLEASETMPYRSSPSQYNARQCPGPTQVSVLLWKPRLCVKVILVRLYQNQRTVGLPQNSIQK